MHYNYWERRIAYLLGRFPGIKNFVKRFYQWFNLLAHRKKYLYYCEFGIKELDSESENFFGYYDKSPLSKKSNHIIFQSSPKIKTKRIPCAEEPIELRILNNLTGKYKCIDKIYSYNWQQGSKLMWINENEFIYNNFHKLSRDYCSVIFNIKTEERKMLRLPIYDCHSGTGLTLNFDRLHFYRPDYGYRNKLNLLESDLPSYKDDGIFKLNLLTGATKLIISIKSIIDVHHKPTMENAHHWFNHIMISPDGKKFIFLHRWIQRGRKYDSLIVSNLDGTNIKVLSDDDMVSHSCWYGNEYIVSYLRDKKYGDKYYSVNINSGEKKIIGGGKIDQYGDGHPSIINNKLIFDTYPNKSRMQQLYSYDINTDELNLIGEFYTPLKFHGETRCDLHPKYSYDGNSVFIDSTHSGIRKLYEINLVKE